MSNILKLDSISKVYKDGPELIRVLNGLNLDVNKGDFIAISGKSGSGKSTLLNLIGLMDCNYTGNIYYEGSNISNVSGNKLDFLRNRTYGFIFQFFNLFPEFTVLENVIIPGLVIDYRQKKELKKIATGLLEEFGLKDRLNMNVKKLSGGEKQRVAIARALINDPGIILADEPTGNLDQENSEIIHELLKKINKEKGKSIIVVTHSRELSSLANRQYILKNGKLESKA